MTYRPRTSRPLLIVRARAQTLRLEVWDDAAKAEPTAGTVTIYDDQDAVVVSAAITVVGGVATYALLAATVPATLDFSDAWRAVWELTLSGAAEVFEQPAALVRASWREAVTPGDLIGRHGEFAPGRELDPQQEGGDTTLGTWIEEAGTDLFVRLWGDGKRPWLILDPWAARRHVLPRALALGFRFTSTFSQDGSRLVAQANDYDKEAEAAYGQLQFRYDAAQTGKPADAPKLPAVSAYFLSSNRGSR